MRGEEFMLFIHEIPHLSLYRLRTFLPRDQKNQNKGCMVILNNPTIEDNIEFMSHPKMLSFNKYLRYYMDPRYMEKIGVKRVMSNQLKGRQEIYEKVSTKHSNIVTPLRFELLQNRNVFYDLLVYNQIYFKNQRKQLVMKDRISNYFDYLNSKINQERFNEYHTRILVMSLDAWERHADYINSPVMYIFLAFRKWFDLLSKLGDIDIILYNAEFMMRINPSKCSPKDFSAFKLALSRVYKGSRLEDEYLDKLIAQTEISNGVSDALTNVFNFTGNDNDPMLVDINKSIKKIVDTKIPEKAIKELQELEKAKTDRTVQPKEDSKVEDNSIEDQDFENKRSTMSIDDDNFDDSKLDEELDKEFSNIQNDVLDGLEDDPEILHTVNKIMKNKTVGKSTASSHRDEVIKKKQEEVKLKNISVKELKKAAERNPVIPTTNLKNVATTLNENMKELKFINFDKTYIEKSMARDTLNILTNLNNKSIPTYVIDVKVEDSSNELNYKETYRITMEDENRVRHQFSIDMPKFVDDKYLYINGSKKRITKQLVMKPIVKTGPDAVQVVSNYNKIFIYREGVKSTKEIERLRMVLSEGMPGITYEVGDNTSVNRKYPTSLEYDDLSSKYTSISYMNKGRVTKISFNQDDIRKNGLDKGIDEKKLFPLATMPDGKIVYCDSETGLVNGKPLLDAVVELLGEEFSNKYYEKLAGGKRYMYSEASIMNKRIPVILLLSYLEGLTTVLDKSGIKYTFDENANYDPHKQDIIPFSDGYLIYDKYPIENQILMNGLAKIPTGSVEFLEMDDKDIYIDFFEALYGSTMLMNALINFYEFMIDPITKEVLEDLNYPTDFVSVLLVANNLLVDNSYINETNMNLYRVRSVEVVNAILHEKLARAYSSYRATASNKRPVKISIPRDAVLKELMALTTVETHSTINPIYEAEKTRTATVKGYRGMNLENAFTIDKRSYDSTMVGIVGMSTPTDANVGVMRHLTMEPNITSARGYLEIKNDNLDELKDVNLFTPSEMLSPLGATKDDSVRTAMATKQSMHIIPVAKSSPVLISNGAEKVVQYSLSKDFIFKAKDDGEVVEVNPDAELIIVRYKSGEHEAIDIKQRTVKNSQSGMYLPNKLAPHVKVGEKFKKNQILASEENFFTQSSMEGNRMNIGSLQKVAVMSYYATLEDSGMVTKKMAEEMASDIILSTDAVIGPNAEVNQIVKIGDHVEVGDPLVTFSMSYEDDSYNKLLMGLSDDMGDVLESLNRTPIKAKTPGKIVDIKIYCTVDLNELSPSLKKIVSEYYASINTRKKVLDKYDNSNSVIKAGMLFDEPTGKVAVGGDGTIKGRKVFDGVLIEFYVEHRNPLAIGDKFIFFTALKSICGEIIPEGYEPYAINKPEEEISSFIGPSAILARKTPSVITTIFGNKVLVELKNKLKEIYNK